MCIRDSCGNQDSLVQVLIVEDNEAPTFIGSAPSGPVDCDNIPVAANIAATDNCDGNASLVFSEEIGTGCPYTITRKWVATDNCGNQDSLVQVLTVEDNEAPTFIGSAPSSPVDCANIPVVANITITDNCDCLLYTSPSPRDATLSRMPSSA